MKQLFFFSIPHFPKSIGIHIPLEKSLSKTEKEEILLYNYEEISIIFFSIKGRNSLPSECLEMILDLRRKLKTQGKSIFFVEITPSLFTILNTIGISSLECFESLSEAVASVG